MGLGGGFLMTIWDASNKTADYLDAREIAPLDANENMFQGDPQLAMFGKMLTFFFIIITHVYPRVNANINILWYAPTKAV